MRHSSLLFVSALLIAPVPAWAGTADGSGALALAAIVGQTSPLLGDDAKALLAKLLDGETKTSVKPGQTLSVTADKITCKASNVDITLHACELVFGSRTVSLKGRSAHELYATLIEVGVPADAGAGSVFEAVAKLDCKIDPGEVMANAGGGAHCDYAAAE